MKWFYIIFLLALFFATLPSCVSLGPAAPGLASNNWPVKQCGPVDSHPEVTVCYYETGPNPQGDPILFLHGLGDSAQVFIQPTIFPSNYPDLIQALSAKPVKIVTISYGFSWLITDYPNRQLLPMTATTAVFSDVLDKISAHYKLSGKWHLMGHSMGGANAATVFAKFGSTKFLSLTLINPMLVTDATNIWDPSIYGSLFSGKQNTNTCDACLVYDPNYPLLDQWTWKNYRPSAMLSGSPIASVQNLPVYITACQTDNFNLWPGGTEWMNQARAKGLQVTFEQGAAGCDHFHFSATNVAKSTGLF